MARTSKSEIHTGDLPVTHASDIDLTLDQQIIHGEEMPRVAHDNDLHKQHADRLAFNEEPVTIIVNEANTGGDFPETHVPVQVNGKGAEVLINGKWTEMTWLPIGQTMTVKRKYVEVLAGSKSTAIKTQHDDATVPNPRNTVSRRTKAQYPMSIIEDRNPRGREWLSALMLNH